MTAIPMFMLFAGCIVIAESWFGLWRSDVFGAAATGAVFRYGGMVVLIGLMVGAPEE